MAVEYEGSQGSLLMEYLRRKLPEMISCREPLPRGVGFPDGLMVFYKVFRHPPMDLAGSQSILQEFADSLPEGFDYLPDRFGIEMQPEFGPGAIRLHIYGIPKADHEEAIVNGGGS